MDLQNIYRVLLRAYGPQGWWPVTDAGKKKPTYRKRQNLSAQQQLEVMVGAILTQNTSLKNVEKAILQLQQRKLLNITKLLQIPQQRLAGIIRSSGYHNQKAKKLKAFAKFLSAHPIAALQRMPLPELRTLLLAQHGIGPETADSILLYAFNKPSFVIDAYTRRICARIDGWKELPYHELQRQFMKALPADAQLFNEYHALLVEHAKQHCKKIPMCTGCPLLQECSYGKKSIAKFAH